MFDEIFMFSDEQGKIQLMAVFQRFLSETEAARKKGM